MLRHIATRHQATRHHLHRAPLRRRAATGADASTLTIVAVNDVYELDHLPRLKTLLDRVRATRPHTIATLAGDFVSPSVLSGLDRGRGMVRVLNLVGVDFACLGNHEADVGLAALARRCGEFEGAVLNGNVPGAVPGLAATATVLGGRVGLLGLLTSEPGVFRGDTFRGLEIADSLATAETLARELRANGCERVVALTHQSLAADDALARSGCVDLILGGHEHEVILAGTDRCPVVKAGADATTAAVCDLDVAAGTVAVAFEAVASHAEDPAVAAACADQTDMLAALDAEKVVRGAGPLSSRRTRFEQTSVGTALCSATRAWFGCDAAAVNGGSVKGDRDYGGDALSFLDLRRELPFPTKMVVVDLPGAVLADAVAYSRSPRANERGFLQLCDACDVDGAGALAAVGGAPLDRRRTYAVALPRNLFKGIFDVRPLVDFAAKGGLGSEDDFLPMLNCVLYLHAHGLWRRLGSFDELDLDGDGQLTRDEVAVALERRNGAPPSPIFLDNVMAAIDLDNSGTIDRDEFAARRIGR